MEWELTLKGLDVTDWMDLGVRSETLALSFIWKSSENNRISFKQPAPDNIQEEFPPKVGSSWHVNGCLLKIVMFSNWDH